MIFERFRGIPNKDIKNVTSIIIPGQSSIIGVSKIKETPIVDNSEAKLVKMMTLMTSVVHD